MQRSARVMGLGLAVLAMAACERVYPHRVLPAVELGDASVYPTLEAYAGSPIVGGNAVAILLNGDEIFPAVLEAIARARTSISYAQYFYEDGEVARHVAEASSWWPRCATSYEDERAQQNQARRNTVWGSARWLPMV